MQRKIIVILGPTASGKTALGVEIAKKFNGEIISADSRQVFRGLDLGTGKDLDEYDNIKYHLIDICAPGEKFTLFEYLPLARTAIEDILSRGKLPIIVGGTNLYIKALVEGFDISQKSPERNALSEAMAGGKVKSQKSKSKVDKFSREFLNKQPTENLIKILKKIDPDKFKTIDQKNPRRLIRAIEIAQEGSKPTKIKPDFEVLQIAIDIPRKKLYERIDKRVDVRFKQGMLEEVVGLIESGVSPKWLLELGLEYKIITDFVISQKCLSKVKINNTEEFEKMTQELKWKSHQFAKRQLSWLHNLAKPVWVKNKSEAIKLTSCFLAGK